MPIVLPKRVFLDSCLLKRLARGEWPAEERELRDRIHRGSARVIITGDHVTDYGDCSAENLAMKEASFVDTLHPLWLPPGNGVYHREAYSEYRRLTGDGPLPSLVPTDSHAAAMAQWIEDCPCLPSHRAALRRLAEPELDTTFSGMIRGGFLGDSLGVGPTLADRLAQRSVFSAKRETARRRGTTDGQLDRDFRVRWVMWLSNPPAVPPGDDLINIAHLVDFSRMPAWTALIAIWRTWNKSNTKPKQSDLTDMQHLALLPYVNVFITEKNLADMIRQAKVGGSTLVYTDVTAWFDGEEG